MYRFTPEHIRIQKTNQRQVYTTLGIENENVSGSPDIKKNDPPNILIRLDWLRFVLEPRPDWFLTGEI